MRRKTAKKYMALLHKRRRSKKRSKAWISLGRKAASLRRRMINPHPVQKRMPSRCLVSSNTRKLLSRVTATPTGKKVAARFKQFWKIPCPPSVKTLKGGKGTVPLVGMGTTDQVHIATKQKGSHGNKTRVIKGKWTVACDASGKHVLLLGSRPMAGQMKSVGFAPVTFYVPHKDIEQAGTHKSGYIWKHKHGERDGRDIPQNELVWPEVFADRNGKVDSSSNFVYGSTKHGKITSWMYH